MDIEWVKLLMTVIMSLVSGFTGGWIVAFHMGSWRQKVESKLSGHDSELEQIKERLGSGKVKLDHVPTIQVKLEAMVDSIKEVKDELQYQRENYVHVRECHKHREIEDGE